MEVWVLVRGVPPEEFVLWKRPALCAEHSLCVHECVDPSLPGLQEAGEQCCFLQT